MIFLSRTKIKQILKKAFPFLRYRWHFIKAFNKLKSLSFSKIRHFLYYKRSERVAQKDLSQEIFLRNKCKFMIEPLNELNKNAVREYINEETRNDLHSLRIRHHYINTYNGFIAFFQGNVVGHLWWWSYKSNPKPPDEFLFYNLKIEKDTVYLYDFDIASPYRGGGGAIDFLTRSFFELKKLGYKRTVGVHDPKNLAARWTYKVIGEKDIKTINVHIFLNTLVYYDKAIFLKKWYKDDPCTSRMLLSFRKIFKNL